MLNDSANSSSVHEQLDTERHWESSRRGHRFLGVTLVLVIAALAGLAWYGYPALQKHESAIAKLTGIQPAMDALDNKIKDTGSQLKSLVGSQEDMRRQIDRMRGELRTRLETAGKQTSEATAGVVRRVEAELDARMNGLQERVASLESSRDTDRVQMAAQIASLKNELNQVRGEVTRQAEQIEAARRESEGSVARTDQQISRLVDSEQRDRKDVNQIAGSLATERVGFEVSKGHSRQLAPGISLGLTATDVLHRRVSGWMWIMPERRTIWLRQQSVQVPVVFYGMADGKKHELVITQVAPNSVAGYVILPKGAGSVTGSSATDSGPVENGR